MGATVLDEGDLERIGHDTEDQLEKALRAAQRPLQFPSQGLESNPRLLRLMELRLKHHWSIEEAEDVWHFDCTLAGSGPVSLELKSMEERWASLLGFADGDGTVRSMIGFIRAIFSTPELEEAVLTGLRSDDPLVMEETTPTVCREFNETPAYLNAKKMFLARHRQDIRRKDMDCYVLGYSLYSDKFGSTKKTSKRSLIMDVFNLKRASRHLQALRHVLAVLDKATDGTGKSLYPALRILSPEAQALFNGVEVYCERDQKTVIIYGILLHISGDSKERCIHASVNSPGGLQSDHCCTLCLASLEDFGHRIVGEARDFAKSKAAILKARSAPTEKAQVEILKGEFLHISALQNPLFWWPGVDNLFALVTSDSLHSVQFFGKKILQELLDSDVMTTTAKAVLEARIAVVNQQLDDQHHVSSLEVHAQWFGREARNFILLAPYLLWGIVPGAVLDLWTWIATLFSIAYSPEITSGMIIAAREAAAHAVESVLALYKHEDMTSKKQLNLHMPLHLHGFLSFFGPAPGFDTERAENAQSKVADFAHGTDRKGDVEVFALRKHAAWQTLQLQKLASGISEEGQKLHSRLAGNVLREIKIRGHQPFHSLDDIPLCVGSVVCTLRELEIKEGTEQQGRRASPADSGNLYNYYEVLRVDSTKEMIKLGPLLPARQQSFKQQTWARKAQRAQPKSIPVSMVHRAVVDLPEWADMGSAEQAKEARVIIPTCFSRVEVKRLTETV